MNIVAVIVKTQIVLLHLFVTDVSLCDSCSHLSNDICGYIIEQCSSGVIIMKRKLLLGVELVLVLGSKLGF